MPGHYQHIPVETYKENLKKIVQHPATIAQNPRILILTPPPVNEYQLEAFDIAKDTPHPSRTVKQTKLYSEAAREVAASLGVAVVDLWTAFMTAAGWKDGEPLIGSRDAPNNEKLQSFFTDGSIPVVIHMGLVLIVICYRIAFDRRRVSTHVSGSNEDYQSQVAGSSPRGT